MLVRDMLTKRVGGSYKLPTRALEVDIEELLKAVQVREEASEIQLPVG